MPLIEYLTSITNLRTGRVWSALSFDGFCYQTVSFSHQRRTSVVDSLESTGGFDANRALPDALKFLTVTCQFQMRYGPGDTYQSMWDAFAIAVNTGDQVQLAFVQPDGTTRYNDGKVLKVDKAMAADYRSSIVIPVTFVLPDPRFYQIYKASVPLSDTTYVSDEGQFSDVDPDDVAITTTVTTHTINYGAGGATVENEDITFVFTGPLVGPITIYDDSIPIDPLKQAVWSLTYNASVAAGEVVTIDTGAWTATSSNSLVPAYGNLLPPPAGQGALFKLQVGTNAIRYVVGSGSNNGIISMRYRPLFS